MTTEQKVLVWADEKGILSPKNRNKQTLKFISEAGELSDEICKEDVEAAKVELGDVLVTLSIVAAQMDTDLQTCFDLAYEKISKRKGKTINGTFIKE